MPLDMGPYQSISKVNASAMGSWVIRKSNSAICQTSFSLGYRKKPVWLQWDSILHFRFSIFHSVSTALEFSFVISRRFDFLFVLKFQTRCLWYLLATWLSDRASPPADVSLLEIFLGLWRMSYSFSSGLRRLTICLIIMAFRMFPPRHISIHLWWLGTRVRFPLHSFPIQSFMLAINQLEKQAIASDFNLWNGC